MNNTRIYKDKQFRFLAVTLSVALGLVLMLPDNQRAEANADLALTPTALPAPTFDLSRHDLYLEDGPKAISEKTITLKSGDSLGPLLQKNGIEANVAYAATAAFSEVYNPRHLRVGEKFNLLFENDNLKYVTFKPNLESTVFLTRHDGDSFAARNVNAEFEKGVVTVKSTIENSLYLDANNLGAPDKVIQQFANIYEYSVDFQRDIQPGDAFEMFFEVTRDRKGNMISAGDLLYTSFSPRGKTMDYYLYQDDKGFENFYDKDGKTAKRKLRATPINGARLSSSYGKRRHPIKGYVKMHKGVDFAAPRGTPVLAAGSGVVERANRFSTYGNYVRIRHTDGYKTAYAHLNGFAKGIKAGSRVRQDQVIAYVGTTGASTGPHLHYEVLLNGRHINPSRLSQLSGKPLAKSAMPAFEARRDEIDAMRGQADVVTRPVLRPAIEPEMVAELTSEKVD